MCKGRGTERQRERNKRSRQRSLLELLVPRSVLASGAPGGEPLKPAGTDNSSIVTTNFNTGSIAIGIDKTENTPGRTVSSLKAERIQGRIQYRNT